MVKLSERAKHDALNVGGWRLLELLENTSDPDPGTIKLLEDWQRAQSDDPPLCVRGED